MAHLARVSRDMLYESRMPSAHDTPRPSLTTAESSVHITPPVQRVRRPKNPKNPSKGKGPIVPLEAGASPRDKGPAPSPLKPTHPNNDKPPRSRRKNHRQKPKATTKMADPALIPPHLRNKQSSTSDKKHTEVEAPAQSHPVITADNTRPTSPPSPPSTPEEPIESIWTGWDKPKPQPSNQPQKPNNCRWPAKKEIPKKTRWPKNRDMRPRSDDNESNGGVDFKSNSNGDPDYDVKKLIDWNGDWLPPPVEWSARNRFADRHFGASIEKWINGHDLSCTVDLTDVLFSSEYIGIPAGETIITKELAPRTWVPSKIEGDAPHQFWRALPSRAPPPLEDINLFEHRPFWEAYDQNSNSYFLDPPEAPKALMDENDVENQLPQARLTATEALEKIHQRKQNKMRKLEAKRNRSPPPLAFPAVPTLNQLKPTANIYLRPVMAADARGIQELYNYYVTETIKTPEFLPREISHIVDRINAVTNENLPYIVAIARNNKPRGPQHYVSERMVGFASMDDFCDKGSTYRFTFELEFFVHPGYVRKGIAGCLLDRMLEFVNTSYQCKGGYEWINRGDYLSNGAGRVVKTINLSVPHEEDEDIGWLTKFLKDFKFVKSGHLRSMGYKKGKVIDVTSYQHITSEQIDPNVPPREPL